MLASRTQSRAPGGSNERVAGRHVARQAGMSSCCPRHFGRHAPVTGSHYRDLLLEYPDRVRQHPYRCPFCANLPIIVILSFDNFVVKNITVTSMTGELTNQFLKIFRIGELCLVFIPLKNILFSISIMICVF